LIVEGAFVEKALSELVHGWTAWFRKKAAKKVLAEALLREIRFNAAMVYEARSISSEEQLGFDVPIFLRKMRSSASEIIVSSGFPLSELFEGPWAVPESANQFGLYLRDCNTKTELLEKMLHRVLVLKTLAQENMLGEKINFHYATFLLREAEKVVKESLRSNGFSWKWRWRSGKTLD